MFKIIIYGTGEYYKNNIQKISNEYEIVGYADSNKEKSTSISGKYFNSLPIYTPAELSNQIFDYVYICTSGDNVGSIFNSLIANCIGADKIRFLSRIDACDGKWEYTASDDNKAIISKINDIRIREERRTDFDITADIFLNNVYNIFLPFDKYIVVDMGMNIGVASLYFASREEVEKVYAFEPFPDTYKQAINNIEMNIDKIKNKISAYNYGLLDKNQVLEVSDSSETGWRSVFYKGNNSVKIECKEAGKELTRIIEENKDCKVVLKIDVEGSEYAIFKSLNQYECFEKIDAVLMEYHNGNHKLISVLKEKRFKIVACGDKDKLGMIYAVK